MEKSSDSEVAGLLTNSNLSANNLNSNVDSSQRRN